MAMKDCVINLEIKKDAATKISRRSKTIAAPRFGISPHARHRAWLRAGPPCVNATCIVHGADKRP